MFIFRKFRPIDMFSVIRLSSENLSERYNPSLFNYFYESYPKGFLVCELNHKIIGFIVGLKLNSEMAKILMLTVSKKYQKRGIGSQLLSNFLKQLILENVKQVELEVRQKNPNGIKFYNKFGFEIVDSIIKFYENGDDAFIMRLIL